jgi:hypothetical protein
MNLIIIIGIIIVVMICYLGWRIFTDTIKDEKKSEMLGDND